METTHQFLSSGRNLFYHIHSAADSLVKLTGTERRNAFATWLCRTCQGVLPTVDAIDIEIADKSDLFEPLTSIAGGCVAVARDEFLDLFVRLTDGDPKLYRGKVSCEKFGQLTGWTTINTDSRIIIRGTKHASSRICNTCGREVYFGMGKRYLNIPNHPDLVLGLSDLDGIIVRSDLFDPECLDPWRSKLHIECVGAVSTAFP